MSTVPFARVRVRVDEPRLENVARRTDAALLAAGVRVDPGTEVAIAVGSRGIADLVTLVARVAAWIRAQEATPFVVPAMGSHGGATGPGQTEVLASYGVTEAAVGCEIRSSMDVVALTGPLPDEPSVPVVIDAHAAGAAATVLVNRVKPHTDFHGTYESGLVKMAAIGLGKRTAAEALHAHGVRGLRELMPRVAADVLRHGNIVLGLAVVENALEQTMVVEAVPAIRILADEPPLLELAGAHLARLPVEDLDVLLIDRMGKDISGVGMDTNVIGRLLITGQPEPASPRVSMIGCHTLTAASHGNATGVGLAEVVTRALADAVDHEVTRTNIVTSGFLQRGKLPVVAANDAQLWELCLRGAGVVDRTRVRAARIVDTLQCTELWLSPAVLDELAARPDLGLEVLATDLHLHDGAGALHPF